MTVERKYYKNSNTGDLITSQRFVGYSFEIPVYWYRNNKLIGENLNIVGYVEISEKKYNRELKNLIKLEQK